MRKNKITRLMPYFDEYKKRFGYYPKEVLADQIYCNRDNRRELKRLGIKLLSKPLGRPSMSVAVKEYVRPGERNPIEGKFGQGKNAYGLGRIKARLKDTSQSWIASIVLILNLVKLARLVLYCLLILKMQMLVHSWNINDKTIKPLFVFNLNNGSR
jgi:transposase, IS5 family